LLEPPSSEGCQSVAALGLFDLEVAPDTSGQPNTLVPWRVCLAAVEKAFGGDADYAVLHKIFGAVTGDSTETRYSPAPASAAK
jgi:hypothetical protein